MTRIAMLVTFVACAALVRCTAADRQTAVKVGQTVCQVIEKYDADSGVFVLRMHVMPDDAGAP